MKDSYHLKVTYKSIEICINVFFFLHYIIANICKQIMQKLLMRKYRGHTHCQNQMKPIRPGSTKKSRDDLLYIFNGDMYTMYMVLDVLPNDNYECLELNTEEKFFTRHPSLNFGKVGIFKNHGLTTIKKIIHISEISGKVISNQNLLFTVPMNVLTQI